MLYDDRHIILHFSLKHLVDSHLQAYCNGDSFMIEVALNGFLACYVN